MEEKERYEYFFGTNTIKDNKTNQFYGCVVDLLNQQSKRIKELENENQQLKQQLEESEKETKHWHDLYKDRDNQFQSIRQRYHLLNRLQAKYDDKNKLHLSEMHCLELVNENEQLKQQLAITEKALELACREITGSCEYCSYKTRIECPVEADCLDEKINYFKSQAKEIINGYKQDD